MNDMNFKNDYNIFKLLPLDQNSKLTDFDKIDKEYLIHYLSAFYLELRNRLSIESQQEYGLEFEFENTCYKTIEDELHNKNFNSDWDLKCEQTIPNGYEITSPTLTDSTDTWNRVDILCEMLRENAKIGTHSGAHVHIGADIFENSKDALLNFILLWSCYENVIFRFLYGEFLNERKTLKSWSNCLSYKLYNEYNKLINSESISNIQLIRKFYYCNKTAAINFLNVSSFSEKSEGNTVEFRAGNGSLDPIIWQNYLNLYIHMIEYCKSSSFDKETIMHRVCTVEHNFSKLKSYRKIYLEEALEFCDLIFDNNKDKIYFLRQYIKDGRTTIKKSLTPSKPFTKTLYKSK